MKKIFILFLISIFTFSLISCQNTGDNSDTQLIEERTKATNEINNSVNLDLYREEQATEITTIIEQALNDIQNAKTVEDVLRILDEALSKIALVKTNEELISDEIEESQRLLLELKNTKKSQLETIVSLDDYLDHEKGIINSLISEYKTKIDAANSQPEVNSLFEEATTKINDVKTKAEIEAELGSTIEEQKSNAISSLNSYVVLNNYRENEKSEITAIISSKTTLINEATTLEAILAIVDDAKTLIDQIKTNEQLLQIELQNAKLEYSEEFTSLKNSGSYYPNELQELTTLVNQALLEIENAPDITSLNSIYEGYMELVSAIKTMAQIDEENKTPEEEVPIETSGDLEIQDANGYNEGVYVEWNNVTGAESYNVYYKDDSQTEYTKVDGMLIRTYQAYTRVDIVGLRPNIYEVKVVCVVDGAETLSSIVTGLKVIPYVREGYAFVNGTSSGAYNEDGSLRSNAIVLYITNENKDTITTNITGANSNPCVGFDAITQALKKGRETRPVVFRLIGDIRAMSKMQNGDIVIEDKLNGAGITVEGIGNDTYANGWGIRLKNAKNVEIRNIGFMLTNSGEKDNVGLQQNNSHIWVHDNDFFYGKAGSASDQNKGDGALDTKRSMYVTHSYNHFFDTGKTHLNGNGEDTSSQNFISYFGNWYDHSDSRHPRVRKATVHVYNNLYDGISKYGVGATLGASIFVENNVFKNTTRPIMSSKQGTDTIGEGTFSGEAGGSVKDYNNLYINSSKVITYQENNTSFDAYKATSRNEQVPATVKTLVGGYTYNNFDTQSDFYSYNVIAVEDVEAHVKANSGRVQGGDFSWTFTVADQKDYNVNSALMSALTSYHTSIVKIGSGVLTPTNPTDPTDPTDPTNPTDPTLELGDYYAIATFASSVNYNGEVGIALGSTENYKTGMKATQVGSTTQTVGLKMQSATEVTITLEERTTVVLYLRAVKSSSSLKLNGETINLTPEDTDLGILTITLDAGTYTFKKGSDETILMGILFFVPEE